MPKLFNQRHPRVKLAMYKSNKFFIAPYTGLEIYLEVYSVASCWGCYSSWNMLRKIGFYRLLVDIQALRKTWKKRMSEYSTKKL